MFRKIVGGAFLGLLAGGVIVMAMEALGHLVFPPPVDFDFSDREAVRTLMLNAPAGALCMVALAWLVGSFGGAFVGCQCC